MPSELSTNFYEIPQRDLIELCVKALESPRKMHCGSEQYAKAVRHRLQRLRNKDPKFRPVKFYVVGAYIHVKRPVGRPVEILDSEMEF